VPNKVKHLVWRACNNSLPSKLNLFCPHVVEDPLCTVCGQERESVTHILWECPLARNVWALSLHAFKKCLMRGGGGGGGGFHCFF
jgi:hypothetical protein